jgi:hypothetical protein
LGKTEKYEKWLKNPSNVDATIIPYVSNPSNFDVFPENIFIPAHGKSKITIIYTPS